jgi:AraC-like DNA-binding protein
MDTSTTIQQTPGKRGDRDCEEAAGRAPPGLQDVARELYLSTRTLQRRLTDEGATFQQLVEDARHELANTTYCIHRWS